MNCRPLTEWYKVAIPNTESCDVTATDVFLCQPPCPLPWFYSLFICGISISWIYINIWILQTPPVCTFPTTLMAESSPPPDSHIHPSLHFLTASQPMPMDDSSEDEDLPPAGEVQRSDEMATVHAAATAGPMFVTDLTLFSQYIKGNMELSEELMLKLDAFCSVHFLFSSHLSINW